MAVKNSLAKIYDVSDENISRVLKDPDFAKCMDVTFYEEAILPNGHEFRYKRITSMSRYGRNYFVMVEKLEDEKTQVRVTTQSRKVTVLLDTVWRTEVERVFTFLEMLLRKQ